MTRHVRVVAAALVLFGGAGVAPAADLLPLDQGARPDARPGWLRLGPFYLTPRLEVGNIGLDTNVFYTPTDRRTDISGSGGPALNVVLPIRGSLRLVGDGGLSYVHFVRTASQRQWGGSVTSRLEWSSARTRFALEARQNETFGRPSTEVDLRVNQTRKAAQVRIHRQMFGRTALSLAGTLERHETASGQVFLGTDLDRTLTHDAYSAHAGLQYALTVKTSLTVDGEYTESRFPNDGTRDGRQMRAAGGLLTDQTALISGRAVAGVRWFLFENGAERRGFYSDVDATWKLTPKLRLGAAYRRDITYTAFVAAGGTPALHVEQINLSLRRDITRRVDLEISARRLRTRTDQPVRLELASGTIVESRRDVNDVGSVGLGYSFKPQFRLGLAASYAKRASSISDLGVEGLLLGATVVFSP